MGIGDFIRTIRFPDKKDLIDMPSKLRNEMKNAQHNKVTVRFFNSNFSVLLWSYEGFKSYKTSIPIIYFKNPDNDGLGVIDFDGSSYFDKETGKTVIDVCEDCIFGINKHEELLFDLNKEYYNDRKYGLLNGKTSEKLKEKTGIGYYMPFMLNNVPREIIRLNPKSDLSSKIPDKKTEITKHLLKQLTTINIFKNLDTKDNGVIFGCLIVFVPVGFIIGILFYAFVLGG